MSAYEYKVKIEASSPEEAKRILQAMFDLMKTTRKQTSTEEFIEFANKIQAKPSLIKKAKMFI